MENIRITKEELDKIKEISSIYEGFTKDVATLDPNTLVRVVAVAMEAVKEVNEMTEGHTGTLEGKVLDFLFTQVDDLTRENTKLLEERDQARKKLIEPKEFNSVRAAVEYLEQEIEVLETELKEQTNQLIN